jgi:hypothetical protein
MSGLRSRSGGWLLVLVAVGLGAAWWALAGASGKGASESDDGVGGTPSPGAPADAAAPLLEALGAPPPQPTTPALQGVVRAGLGVAGRVLLSGDLAGAGAEVWAAADAPGRPVVSRATADADGAFRLAGLPRGLVYVGARWVSSDTEQGAEMIVQAGTSDVVLRLSRRGPMLELRVVDAEGTPVPSVRLRVVREGKAMELGEIVGGHRVLEGGSRLKGVQLPPFVGAHLAVYDARDASGRALALAPVQVGPLTSDRGSLELRLPAGELLRAEVLAPEGHELGALRVELQVVPSEAGPGAAQVDGAPQAPLPTSIQSTLPPDGHLAIAALRPGAAHALTILTEHRDDLLAVPPLVLEPGAEPVRIRLRRAVSVALRVEGPDGRVLVGIDYGLTPLDDPPGAQPRREMREGDGSLRLVGLDPEARYQLTVHPWAWEKSDTYSHADVAPFHQAEWRPRDTTVRLALGLKIEGSVRDASGAPVAGAQLRPVGVGRAGRERWLYGRSDAEGRFVLRGCPPGTYDLGAWPPHVGDFEGVGDGAARARVEAGRSVVFTFPRWRRADLVLPEGLRRAVEGMPGSGGLGIRVRRRTPEGWVEASMLSLDRLPPAVTVDCLQPDTEYEFLAFPGRPGYWGARLGAQAGQARLERHAGGTIRVLFADASESLEGLRVHANDPSIDHFSGDGQPQPDGSMLIPGLPEGVYEVTAWTEASDRSAVGTARPGETVTLTWKPRESR